MGYNFDFLVEPVMYVFIVRNPQICYHVVKTCCPCRQYIFWNAPNHSVINSCRPCRPYIFWNAPVHSLPRFVQYTSRTPIQIWRGTDSRWRAAKFVENRANSTPSAYIIWSVISTIFLINHKYIVPDSIGTLLIGKHKLLNKRNLAPSAWSVIQVGKHVQGHSKIYKGNRDGKSL